MSITRQIKQDMVAAMKSGDRSRAAALRMILSELQLAGKESRGEFSAGDEQAVLMKEKKRRLQASEAFRSGGREDKAIQEDNEAELINAYLPEALSESELESMIGEAVTATGATGIKDMGTVMSRVMARAAGRADGQAVSKMVKAALSGK